MVDYRDSAILRRLVLEKLDAGRLAGRDVSRNDAGLPMGGRTDPLADAAHREEPRIRSGIREKTGSLTPPVSFQGFGERQHRGENGVVGDPFLRLVANNVDVVPTRQKRGRVRFSLVRT